MATKNNPGEFDCYGKLHPDEEYFLLRGKDPCGPYLVRIWVAMRLGEWLSAIRLIMDASCDKHVRARVSPNPHAKLAEAAQCAEKMEDWHRDKFLLE